MAKIVTYNGGTEHFYASSKPTELEKGEKYEVMTEEVNDFHTEYTFKGVKGKYNSCWFDEVEVTKPVFMAIGNKIPELGKRYACHKIGEINGYLGINENVVLIGWMTSIVEDITYMGNNIYNITTTNSIYIVRIN